MLLLPLFWLFDIYVRTLVRLLTTLLAAVKAVVEAAGGTVNMVSFTRGAYDVVVDMNLPSQEMMMGAMATVEASGSMSETMYLECVDGDPIWDAARSIATAYKPANA